MQSAFYNVYHALPSSSGVDFNAYVLFTNLENGVLSYKLALCSGSSIVGAQVDLDVEDESVVVSDPTCWVGAEFIEYAKESLEECFSSLPPLSALGVSTFNFQGAVADSEFRRPAFFFST